MLRPSRRMVCILVAGLCGMVRAGAVEPTIDLHPVVDPPAVVIGHDPIESRSLGYLSCGEGQSSPFVSGYDDGFFIKPACGNNSPYSIKANAWMQFRHSVFSRDAATFTDAAGVTTAIEDRNAFDIERARMIFSGGAIDPRLTYRMQFDADTDGINRFNLLDFWVDFAPNETISVRAGRMKLPGSRLWLTSPLDTRLAARPLATTFFRPGRTTGVQFRLDSPLTGSVIGMVGNNFRRVNVGTATTDNQFTYSVSQHYEPVQPFGDRLTEYEISSRPRLRFGHTFTFAPQSDNTIGGLDDDEDFIRLADGTILNDADVLAPGVTVAAFDVTLYTIDMAVAYQGWSADAELYHRRLDNLQTTAPVPRRRIEQTGFAVGAGVFLVEQTWEVNVRYSEAHDAFGTGSAMGLGTHLYPTGDTQFRLSFDAIDVDASPVNATGLDILVGDDGMLYRSTLHYAF